MKDIMKKWKCSTTLKIGIDFIQLVLVFVVFGISLYGAVKISSNNCPDEGARRLLTDWIHNNGKLPIGNEPELQIPNWGFSYATRPYFTSMIGALFETMVGLFSKSDNAMLLASRFMSVVSLTLCAVYSFLIGNELFEEKIKSTLFGSIICFLPQSLFLGMYLNNDSMSLMCVSMLIYYMLKGHKSNWKVKYCIMLALSVAISLLSYYTIYPWILMCGIMFLISLLSNKELSRKDIISKIVITGFVVILLAAWFFVRNAIIFDGDFLGMRAEKESMEQFVRNGGELIYLDNPQKNGVTFFRFWTQCDFRWYNLTKQSFIGVFGYMSVFLDEALYQKYYLIIFGGILIYIIIAAMKLLNKTEKVYFSFLFLSSFLVVLLSVFQSYTRDNQPQGRYIITIVFLFAYIITSALEKIKFIISSNNFSRDGKLFEIEIHIDVIILLLWFVLFINAFIKYLLPLL